MTLNTLEDTVGPCQGNRVDPMHCTYLNASMCGGSISACQGNEREANRVLNRRGVKYCFGNDEGTPWNCTIMQ